jgi:hypothetical protein
LRATSAFIGKTLAAAMLAVKKAVAPIIFADFGLVFGGTAFVVQFSDFAAST